jgi:pSer/pThr/pTyr-binding forkhead associated (FHA) protein
MTAPAPAGAAAEPLGPPGRLDGATRAGALALLRGAARGDALTAGPHLAVVEPGLPERIVPLSSDLTVGRSAGAGVRLTDPAASRRHLRLRSAHDGVAAEDLGSRNGLLLNGRRARGTLRLRHGDLLTLGETVIRFADPLAAASGAGEPPPAPPPRTGARVGPGGWWRAASAALLLLAGLALLLP